LNVSLEELFHGATKKMRITRKSVSQGRSPTYEAEIKIKPGWKAGTKITFNGEGDEYSPGNAQDVVFVIKEKPHASFTRDGHDLIFKHSVPLADALTGFKVEVPMLDNKTLRVNVRDVVHPAYTKIVHGEGMPKSKSPNERGDLILTFDVAYPKVIPDDVKEKLKTLIPR